MKIYFLIYYVFFALILGSCAGTSTTPTPAVETIVVTPSVPQEQFFADFVERIEVIPLETREDLFIRNKRVMELYQGDFYISNVDNGLLDDSRGESNVILRFDSSGRFLNKIGNFSGGDGANTYFFYRNYLLDSIVYIFSSPEFCVNKYTLSGDFISKDTLVAMPEFNQAAFFKGNYVVSWAEIKEDASRLRLYDGAGELLAKGVYLESKMGSGYSLKHRFTKYKDTLLYRDEQKDTIYQIVDKRGVSPRVFVDYGPERRRDKERYFKESTGTRAEIIRYKTTKAAAQNNLYYESEDYCLLEMRETEPLPSGEYPASKSRIALKNKASGKLSFVDFNNENTLFDGAVQFLAGKKLYFLVQARHLTPIPEWMRAYFVNPQMLEGVKAEDNDLIFVFTLK